MRQNHLLLASVFLMTIFSCTPKSTSFSMVSQNPPSLEEGIFWIASAKSGLIQTETGPMAYDNCFAINSNDKLEKNSFDNYVFNTGAGENIDFFCDSISGITYEEGYLYKVKAVKGYLGEKWTDFIVEKVLLKEKDSYFKKIEILDIFVAPEKINQTDWSGHKIECFQIQKGQYTSSGIWLGHCGPINGFEYEEGYLYKLRIRRSHLSEFDKETIAEGPSYQDQLITILKKQRI